MLPVNFLLLKGVLTCAIQVFERTKMFIPSIFGIVININAILTTVEKKKERGKGKSQSCKKKGVSYWIFETKVHCCYMEFNKTQKITICEVAK